MTPGDKFKQDHEAWKNRGKAAPAKDEPLRTWLMSSSGHCFPYEGPEVFKSELGREVFKKELTPTIFCIYFNATSLFMAGEQAVVIANRKRK